MTTIRNEFCSASIASMGAELRSLIFSNTEYIWQADPAYWPKSSPILFPIVGTLRNGSYTHNGNSFKLGRHGFAREMDFNITEQTSSCVCFSLISNGDTLSKFPFPFRLDITYSLHRHTLDVNYRVINTGTTDMYFSIGGHPAFRLPLEEHLDYEDYKLHFNKNETAPRWPISPDGLIMKEPVECLDHTDELPLKKSLFYKDALVFKSLKSDEISLRSPKGTRGLKVSFPGFPYLGLWAVKDADFVCIEPWKGIADSTDAGGEFADKEGINILSAQQEWEQSWTITVF